MAVPLRSWKRRFLNPSRRAHFAKMFVTLAGWRKVVKEKPSSSRGVPGKIRLPSGKLDADDPDTAACLWLFHIDPPRKLTQGELARLLRPLGIRPKTIWPAQRSGDKSRRGYGRARFAAAWRAYCGADTPTQPHKLKDLPPS
jgi:hypothetical protein